MTCERTTFYRCDKLFNSFLQLHLLAFATHFDHIDPMSRHGEAHWRVLIAMSLVYLFAIQAIDLHVPRIAHIEVKAIRPHTGVHVEIVYFIKYNLFLKIIFDDYVLTT